MSFLVTGVRLPFMPPIPGLEKLLTPFEPGEIVVRAEKFSRPSIFDPMTAVSTRNHDTYSQVNISGLQHCADCDLCLSL